MRREQRGQNVEGDRRMARFGGQGYGQTVAICCCGVAIRVALCLFGLQPTLEGVMELVVSSASWERAREGLFLGTLGLSHYAGGAFSGSPLMLAMAWLCSMVPAGVQTLAATVLFSAFDVASGLLLRAICRRAVAVESGDWEAQLEGWMDEESKPSGLKYSSNFSPTPNPDSEVTAEAKVDTPDTHREADRDDATSSTNSTDGSGPGGVAWNLPNVVLAVYLFNPVLAGQCAALSGDVLGRVFPLAALVSAGSRRPGATAAALAAATCLWRFYAAPLILPAALMLGSSSLGDGEGSPVARGGGGKGGGSEPGFPASSGDGDDIDVTRGKVGRGSGSGKGRNGASRKGRRQKHDPAEGDFTGGSNGAKDVVSLGGSDATEATSFDPRYFKLDIKAFLHLCAAFAAWCAVVLGVCWLGTSRSWAFLRAAVSGQLLCENLTPNAGLYWYFFAELFPRFRGFFRVLFLSQPYVYILPATLRLGMFPEALASLLLAIFGLFHPYPTLADPMLAGCLFLCHPRTSARMRLVIPVGMVALIPALLLPTMRHAWLQAGTGNANFYYFQTVILNVLLCVFVLQFAAALVKRRKALRDAFEKRRKSEALGKQGGDERGRMGGGVKGSS